MDTGFPCRAVCREARILLVHDKASFRDLIRDVGTATTERVVPTNPAFPP